MWEKLKRVASPGGGWMAKRTVKVTRVVCVCVCEPPIGPAFKSWACVTLASGDRAELHSLVLL